MAYIANAYRRGAVYWWRRQIAIAAGERIMFALSLRTPDPTQARRRAAALTVASERIRRQVLGMNPYVLTTEMRKTIFQDALRQQLDRIIADQVETPELAQDHKQLNAQYAALYRHWATAGPEAPIAGFSAAKLLADGWTEAEVQTLRNMAEVNGPWSMVSRSKAEELLDGLNMAVTSKTLNQVCQVIFAARSRACVLAIELAGEVVPFGDKWTAEVAQSGDARGYPIFSPSAGAAGMSQDEVPPITPPPIGAAPAPPPDDASVARPSSVNLAEALVAWTLTWPDQRQDQATLRQYGTSVRLLIYLIGNVALAALDEDRVANFVGKTKRLKPGYRLGSKGRILLPENSEEIGGLTAATLRRHVTGIKKFSDWARRQYKINGKLDFSGLVPASADGRARDKTLSWTDEDCAQIMATPPFTGCLGTEAQWGANAIHQRLLPGPHIYHDAWYWPVLLYYYTGARREEVCKLLASDIREENGIPYVSIDFTITGRLKNAQSVRRIPLHSELLRLGFLDFVEARRSITHLAINNLGNTDHELFPDLRPTKGKNYGGMFYRDYWLRLVAAAFDRPGDEDIHSFRHGLENFLETTGCSDKEGNDLFGHETKSSTRKKVYGDPTPLSVLATIIAKRNPISELMEQRAITLPVIKSTPPFSVLCTAPTKERKKLNKSR